MSKFIETTYTNKQEILKFPDHYVALAVTVDDTGIVPNSDGRKVVPAGTIVGGGTILDQNVLVKKATTTVDSTDAEGVLFNDVDVTYGPAPGAMIIHGFVDLAKIPEVPDAIEKAALKQIEFIA